MGRALPSFSTRNLRLPVMAGRENSMDMPYYAMELFEGTDPSGRTSGRFGESLLQIFRNGVVGRFQDHLRHNTEDLVSMVENPIIPNGIDVVLG